MIPKPKLTQEQEQGVETIRGYLQSITTDARTVDGKQVVGSQLSVAIDWLIEKLKGIIAGYDWSQMAIQAQLTACNVCLDIIVPKLVEQGGVAAMVATTLLKPWLETQKKRLEDELANPTPPPTPAPA